MSTLSRSGLNCPICHQIHKKIAAFPPLHTLSCLRSKQQNPSTYKCHHKSTQRPVRYPPRPDSKTQSGKSRKCLKRLRKTNGRDWYLPLTNESTYPLTPQSYHGHKLSPVRPPLLHHRNPASSPSATPRVIKPRHPWHSPHFLRPYSLQYQTL